MLFLEFFGEVPDQDVVEIRTAQVGVASGCFYFEESVFDCEERNVECSATEVEYQNILLFSVFFSSPYAMAAAVGSLMILSTLSPAMTPASFVA